MPDSEPPTFTGALLDRAMALRTTPEQVTKLLESPDAAILAAGSSRVLVDTRAGAETLLRAPANGGGSRHVDPTQPVLLGIESGVPLFAVDLDRLEDGAREDLTAGGRLVSLRAAGALLPQSEGGLAAYLVALLNWHRRHGFCANCGAPTSIAEAGLSRHCDTCGADHFPRTDPVVIMVVADGDRMLLGRRPGWPQAQYSILAGFVAPGETPEEAVVREVREESGIEAYGATYVTSQPWPFPSSLMLGFEAVSDGGTPTIGDDGELEEVGWFELHDLCAAQRGSGSIRLPPPISIARTLMDRWLESRC
jgi:NAD+ diphosphatase